MLDAGFLQAEDSDRHVSLAIGAIAVLCWTDARLRLARGRLAERILSVPRFRQVLRTQPLDLGAPRWVDDTNLDISHHVRRAALPRPGDDAALFRWVAEVMERRLDRDRPLWECWIVDGLQHNRWAILMKVHHCIADGIAATHLLSRLCDDGGGGTFATDNPRCARAVTGWTAAAGAHAQPHRLDRRCLAHIARPDNRRGTGLTGGGRDRRRPAASRGGVVADRTGDDDAALRHRGGVTRRCGEGVRSVRGDHQ